MSNNGVNWRLIRNCIASPIDSDNKPGFNKPPVILETIYHEGHWSAINGGSKLVGHASRLEDKI